MNKTAEVNKLLVSWKGTETKANYFVGTLEKKQDGYYFTYNKEIVIDAKKEGFTPFIGLNDLSTKYKSSKLFPVFERRLPNKSRNIYKKVIREHNLNYNGDADWEYLRISKGKLATDSISFLEPIIIRQGKMYYKGKLAGWSFTKEKNRKLSMNDVLKLRNDIINNPREEMAVEVLDPRNNNTRVGYIQKPFNSFFFNLLSKGESLDAEIVSLDEDGRPTLLVYSTVSKKDIEQVGYNYLLEVQSF